MASQRTEAEALAACLELELADVDDAVQWADGQILTSDVPHTVLCEVSMASRASNQDVASMLRKLPGEIDPSFVIRRLIECALRRLQSNPSHAQKIAFTLYELAMDETLPPGPLRKDAWWFYDAIDLAAYGYIQETPDQIIQQMIASLEAELKTIS